MSGSRSERAQPSPHGRGTGNLLAGGGSLCIRGGSGAPGLTGTALAHCRAAEGRRILYFGKRGLNISMIKNLLESTIDQLLQVACPRDCCSGRHCDRAGFGPPPAPEIKLYTYLVDHAVPIKNNIATLVLAPGFAAVIGVGRLLR